MKRYSCTADVHDPFGVSFHKCGATAKFDPDATGKPTRCGVHSSAAQARRKAKRDAAESEWRRKRAAADAVHNATRALEPTLRKIANGANDPRALAAEVLAALDAARSRVKP